MDVGDVPIPLPNVKASILRPVSFHINFFFRSLNSFILQIVEFCNHHKNDPKPEPIDDDDDDDPNKDIYEPKRQNFFS